MILFFDLDGPILDVSHRYVRLHQDLLRPHGHAGMDPAVYWARKRARRSEDDVLAEYDRRRLGRSLAPSQSFANPEFGESDLDVHRPTDAQLEHVRAGRRRTDR